MHSPTMRMNTLTTGQPIEIIIGPPLSHAWLKLVNGPASTEMIENEIAKFWKLLQPRLRSCEYPSSDSRLASESNTSTCSVMIILLMKCAGAQSYWWRSADSTIGELTQRPADGGCEAASAQTARVHVGVVNGDFEADCLQVPQCDRQDGLEVL